MAIDTRTGTNDILSLPNSQAAGGRSGGYAPSLEVDAFVIPPLCRTLADRYGETALAPVAQALASAARRGCCIGGFLGWSEACGCTATTLATAMLLADRGKRVLVVDAAENSGLSFQLGLELEHGWDTAPNQPLRELVIRSVDDRFDLLPRSTVAQDSNAAVGADPTRQQLPPPPLWRRLAELTPHYAFILIDLGKEPMENGPASQGPHARNDRHTAQRKTDLMAACDILFHIRDARNRQDLRVAPRPNLATAAMPRQRAYIIDNFASGT